MTKSDPVALKPLELIFVRDLEKFGDTDYGSPKMLQAELNGTFWWELRCPTVFGNAQKNVQDNRNNKKERHTVLEGNKDSIWKIFSPHLCYILTVNLYTFCHTMEKRMRLN